MEDLNNVPSSGTYGAAINEVNENFSLIVNAINSLEHATTHSKGIYNNGFAPSTTTLPNSVDGDWCMVLGTGNTFPARIWTFNGTTWAQGGTWNPEGLDLTGYAKTTDMNTAITKSLAQATARMGYCEATISNTEITAALTEYVLPVVPSSGAGNVRIKMLSRAIASGTYTLNINSTGAKEIMYNGQAVSPTNTWDANDVVVVYYANNKYWASNAQGGGGNAEKIKYDNSKSGLGAENVQEAVDDIYDVLAESRPVDLSKFTYPMNIGANAQSWTDSSGNTHLAIPVQEGQRIRITANPTRQTYYRFLKDNNYVKNGNVSYCDGYSESVILAKGETAIVTAPAGAWFLYLNNVIGSYIYTPASVVLLGIPGEDGLYSLRDTSLQYYLIADSNNKYIKPLGATVNYRGRFVAVTGGRLYKVVCTHSSNIMAFVTSGDAVNGKDISYAGGLTSRMVLPAGTYYFTAPSDAAYFYYTWPGRDILTIAELITEEEATSPVNDDDFSNTLYGVDFSKLQTYNRVISASTGKWSLGSSFDSKMIPLASGDIVTITANEDNFTYYAFIQHLDDEKESGDMPTYCEGYERVFTLATGKSVNVEAPEDCYLYVLTRSASRNMMPNVYVNNVALQACVGSNTGSDNYSLIYYEDFNDGINKDMWEAANFKSDSYSSEFLADDDNWYADGGCMVLKLEKRSNKYYGPYISTARSLAVKKGKVEVRFKATDLSQYIGWCFWIWGQNGSWPRTLEVDLYEKIAHKSNASLANTVGVNIHYKNSNNEDTTSRQGVMSAEDYGTGWHIAAVEWDENKIVTFLDGEQTSYNTNSTLGSIGTWDYPQSFLFNIKCVEGYDNGDAYMFVDYIKIWAPKDESPITGFIQEDLTLAVGESATINPTFVPADCINQAFVLESDNPSVVSVTEYTADNKNPFMRRKITAVSAGTATLTMTAANGVTKKTFKVTVTS